MANEAVILELGPNGGKPVRYAIPATAALSKGTLCFLEGDYSLSGSLVDTLSLPFAGVLCSEKVSDTFTEASCYTEGTFDLYCVSGASIGNLMVLSGANKICPAKVVDSIMSGAIVGKALETSTTPPETIRVRLGLI